MALDFRLHLQKELLSRCKQTPGYSLRTFAKHLDIDPTALSKILSGKRQMNVATIERLAAMLGLTPNEIESFTVGARGSRAEAKKVESQEADYKLIAQDTFQLISNWYYLAILELTHIKGFVPQNKHIANTLGLTTAEVNIAVEALQRLGFLEINAKGVWVDKYTNLTNIKESYTTAGMRALQKQILTKAIDALDVIPVEKREQRSMTFSGDSKLIEQAKAKIRDFLRELTAFMQDHRQTDAVYQMSISMFPLTKTDGLSKNKLK